MGEAVLGPAFNNKPLPAFLIKFQVRHGLGAMPAFSKEKVGDDELDALVAYLLTPHVAASSLKSKGDSGLIPKHHLGKGMKIPAISDYPAP